MIKKIINISFCSLLGFTAVAQDQMDSLYTAMSYAVDEGNWSDALLAANLITKNQKEINPSVEVIKINSLRHLGNLNEPNDPYFKQLENTIDYVLKNTKFSSVKELPLYLEHYEMIYQLRDYLHFVKKKRTWLEDPNFQEGLKNYKIKNYGVAKTYFDKGSINNNAASMLFLGLIFENGLGTKEDYIQAYKYYYKSFQIGNIDAAYHIGFCYFYGLGVVKDINQGYNWCLLAAENNYAQAMAELANRYEKGLMIEKDSEKATFWKEKSLNAYTFKYLETTE